jgi:hypothetical protein
MFSVFSILKLYQCKWKEMCSICSIVKSGTVSRFILPNLNFYYSLIPTGLCLWFLKIWTLSTKVKTEIWSVFAILKIYQREWNRVKSLFNIPKLLQVIDPYQIMSMVFKNDTAFPFLNLLKKSGKRGDLFVPFLNYINKITTVCSSLYTWAVNKNCMEGFLTERWDVRGMVK